jgi:hypothetical protein
VFTLGVVALTLAGFVLTSLMSVNPAWAALAGAVVIAMRALRQKQTTVRSVLAAAYPLFLVFVAGARGPREGCPGHPPGHQAPAAHPPGLHTLRRRRETLQLVIDVRSAPGEHRIDGEDLTSAATGELVAGDDHRPWTGPSPIPRARPDVSERARRPARKPAAIGRLSLPRT